MSDFIPDPNCNCIVCRVARNRIKRGKPPCASLTSAPPPPLSLAWTDAIAAATALGMAKRVAITRAITLSLENPLATTPEALRMLLKQP